MNLTSILIGGVAGAAITIAAIALLSKQGKKKSPIENAKFPSLKDIPVEDVDNLAMKDVIFYFKSLNLKKGIHSPFIAKASAFEELKTFVGGFILGVFKEQNGLIENVKVIKPKTTDNDLLSVLGNEKIVILQ